MYLILICSFISILLCTQNKINVENLLKQIIYENNVILLIKTENGTVKIIKSTKLSSQYFSISYKDSLMKDTFEYARSPISYNLNI